MVRKHYIKSGWKAKFKIDSCTASYNTCNDCSLYKTLISESLWYTQLAVVPSFPNGQSSFFSCLQGLLLISCFLLLLHDLRVPLLSLRSSQAIFFSFSLANFLRFFHVFLAGKFALISTWNRSGWTFSEEHEASFSFETGWSHCTLQFIPRPVRTTSASGGRRGAGVTVLRWRISPSAFENFHYRAFRFCRSTLLGK